MAQKRELTPEEEAAKAKIQKDMKGIRNISQNLLVCEYMSN
jgi:hypothetical protein